MLNSIDYLALLRSVDEMGPDPMLPHVAKLKATQSTELNLSMIEEWLELTGNPSPACKEIGVQAFYEAFAAWELNASPRRMGIKKFKAELRRLVDGGRIPYAYAPRRAAGVSLVRTDGRSRPTLVAEACK